MLITEDERKLTGRHKMSVGVYINKLHAETGPCYTRHKGVKHLPAFHIDNHGRHLTPLNGPHACPHSITVGETAELSRRTASLCMFCRFSWMWHGKVKITPALKMEAAHCSDMLMLTYPTIRCHDPELKAAVKLPNLMHDYYYYYYYYY
jgi:hypothetical protein